MAININRLIKLWKPIKSFQKVTKSFENSIASYVRTIEREELSSNNEVIIKLDAIARSYGKAINQVIKYDETKWVEVSGYNLLDKNTHRYSITFLRKELKHYKALSEAFIGLSRLLKLTRVTDNMNLKGLSQVYAPSLKAIEEIHRYEVIKSYTSLKRKTDKIIKKINWVANDLEKNWTIK